MGEYLQIGVVTKMRFYKSDLMDKNTSQETLRERLSDEINMKLFETHESNDYTDFLINGRIVTSELCSFLSQQFGLYARDDVDLLSEFTESLGLIKANSETYEDLLRLADERSLRCFQSSVVHPRLSLNSFGGINYDADILLFIFEGKILMEGYARYLRYIETLIRSTGADYGISGAVRAFIE